MKNRVLQVICILISVCLVGLLAGCGKNAVTKFDAATVIEQLETKSYTWENGSQKYLMLVVKNNSQFDCTLEADVSFKDADNVIETAKRNILIVASKTETCLVFNTNKSFNDYEYKYHVKDASEYYESGANDINCETSKQSNDEVVVTLTNSGDKAYDIAVYETLFFDSGNLVHYAYRVAEDSDGEFKAGDTVVEEISTGGKQFDEVKVYVKAYNVK